MHIIFTRRSDGHIRKKPAQSVSKKLDQLNQTSLYEILSKYTSSIKFGEKWHTSSRKPVIIRIKFDQSVDTHDDNRGRSITTRDILNILEIERTHKIIWGPFLKTHLPFREI